MGRGPAAEDAEGQAYGDGLAAPRPRNARQSIEPETDPVST